MTCATCRDIGIVKLNFLEGDEFGICLCPMGERLRAARNNGHTNVPLWQVWCAREQADPALVHRIEDVLTADELTERGFTELTPARAVDALAEAARNRRPKR